MDNTKKLIMILISIVIVLILIIICILFKLKNDNNEMFEKNEYVPDVTANSNWELVTIKNDYFTVKNIVERYFSALCDLNKTSEDILIFEDDGEIDYSEEIAKEKEITKKQIYNFFDESYIQGTGLTISNIQEKLGNYKDLYVLIEDMYVKDITISLKLYIISGSIIEKETMKKEDFKLMIAVDSSNRTFNIYTSEYVQKYNLVTSDTEINITEIGNRLYNKYTYKIVSDEEYAKELLDSYVKSVKYNNIKYSYNRLDEEYKKNKFNEISDYEKYIQEKKKQIITSTLSSYKYNIHEGYIQYICVDADNNYYIFNETSTMKYNLILDTYTVDLPEFIEKYDIANKEQKVALNVNKIIKSINNADYKYVYNKLNDTYKNKYFKDYNIFEKYLTKTFYISNEMKIEKIDNPGQDTYNVTISITNEENKGETKNTMITIRLLENRDFEMSFAIQ